MQEDERNAASPPTLVESLTTCIVGGGSSAHVLIPFLSEAGHRVHLLTRRPDDWQNGNVYCRVTHGSSGDVAETHAGRIDGKSSEAADVIPDADIIVLCMPVCKYRESLDRLAPYVSREKEVFIGTIYGQAGFNWMVDYHVIQAQQLTNVVTFAIGSIPWICRTQKYGESVANYGGKQVNLVAVKPAHKFDKLNRIFLQEISEKPLGQGPFTQVDNFMSLTMSVDNQIIHPTRCYSLWQQSGGGKWASAADVPYFYRDFDEHSAENLRRLDADYTAVRSAMRRHFPDQPFTYMLSYLELENLNHKSGNVDIRKSFSDSEQLAAIKTPTVEGPNGSRLLDTNFRFFTDDVGYGMLIAKWVAEKLDVKTPFLDEVITFCQTVRNEHFLDKNGHINQAWCLKDKYTSGIPESYGISSVHAILE